MVQLQGAITALVTPFTADGKSVDYEKLRELVEWQIQEGIDGLVPVGLAPVHLAGDARWP
jgi:4-hydroxy-tetrahydrodipicolinate synthase